MDNLSYYIRTIRSRGLIFLWTYFWESVWFDLYHGTRTSSRVLKKDQEIKTNDTEVDNGLLYVASFTSVTKNTIECARNALGQKVFEQSQFVDLGCGKGKAILIFAKHYGSIVKFPSVGIEYDRNLAAIAERNINKCNFASKKARVFADSAMNLSSYISAEVIVVYLYNSFQGDTFKKVMDLLGNIPHVLIYVDPTERSVLKDYGYSIIRERNGSYNANTWLVATSGL
jgi:hypothetical protein